MHETYLRAKSSEEARGGLVILEALYGNFAEEEEDNDV